MPTPLFAALLAVRQQVDALGQQLLDLLAQRQAPVRQAGQTKPKGDVQAVNAPERVEQIIAARPEGAAERGLDPQVAEAVWRAMIGAFTEYEIQIKREEGANQ